MADDSTNIENEVLNMLRSLNHYYFLSTNGSIPILASSSEEFNTYVKSGEINKIINHIINHKNKH